MEGVPRLYMIGLPAKFSDGSIPDFASAINNEIQNTHDRDPSPYSSDVDALHKIRQSAMKALTSSPCTVDDCTSLKRYYAHLVRLASKFPRLILQPNHESTDDTPKKPVLPLKFAWKRALGGKMKAITTETVDCGDIGFEMRCVLYNLGAAHSRLAAAQDRSPPLTSNTSSTDGAETSSNTALKVACTHLQCAAWAFEQLLGAGEIGKGVKKWHHRQMPLVTNRPVLEFAYNVTLAQAQECILEKSMMDGRKPLIIAKVSAMICDYYAGAIDAVNRVDREMHCVSANRLEKWRLYSEFKCRYYGAVTALFQGQHVQDQLQQMGTRVSYYRRAVNLLGRASLISENDGIPVTVSEKYDDSADDDFYYYSSSVDGHKGSSQSAAIKELEMRRDTLSFSMDVAAAKWRAAKSENELIYHETVIPVLSDDDDSDCLRSNPSSSTGGINSRKLERVKGASLVKPIGFAVDDPELLAVAITNDNDSSNTGSVTTRTLFKDLVPPPTRVLANIYRTEKKNIEENIRSICRTADDELTAFADTLNLDCLDMFVENSCDNEKSKVLDLPEELITCCAAYQAQLQERQQEKEELDEEEDQLDIDMEKLTNAVQSVNSMLDEIDHHLKTEEFGDSEFRRTVGRPYDYSAARMQELRREASRYREAHVGRARDSWVTLSRAVRNRRRRDLQMLTLPMDKLAKLLPPARPSKTAIAAEVAAANMAMESSSAAESSDQNNSNDSKSGHLHLLQLESIDRLERLNLVVAKMHEVKDQRKFLLSKYLEEVSQDNKDSEDQDDLDVLGNVFETEDDVMTAIKKKSNACYGNLLELVEQNVAAQKNILEAVRLAYAHTATERRAYANAVQRRHNAISSLLDAYESYIVSIGGTPTEINNDTMTALPNSGLLPDSALAERCAKGLDFYQRLLNNVSKLLQRVKGTCQVQTEQRDQIMKQHQEWEAGTQQSDDELPPTVGGLDDLLASVSGTVDNLERNQEDLAALIENFSNSSALNKPPAPLGGTHWDQQHNLRRLSPLGSEQQHHYHQYGHPQVKPLPSTINTNTAEYFKNYYGNYIRNNSVGNQENGVNASISQQQTQPAPVSAITTQVPYPTIATAFNIVSSTGVETPTNSTSTSLQSQMPSSYNYYNYQLPSVTSAISPSLSSSSYSNFITAPRGSNEATTTAMMNALRLENSNNDGQNYLSPYLRSSASSINDDSSGGFTSAAAAVAVLQRPLQTPYTSIVGSSNDSEYNPVDKFSYHHPYSALSSRPQQFYQLGELYQQHISNAGSTLSGSIGTGTTGGYTQPHQLTAGSGGVSTCVQTSVALSPTPSVTMNSAGLASAVAIQPSSTTSGTSIATSYFHQPLEHQQPLHHYQQQQQSQLYHQQQQQTQLYQQQQPQLYQQHLQPQQQQQQQQQKPLQSQQQLPQSYQHQMQQMYQQPQPQLQPHQLTNTSGNTSNNMYYTQLPQQQTSQLYQPQQQLQSNAGQQASMAVNQQPPAMSSSGIGSCNYYQPLQYNQHMANIQHNTAQTDPNMYYYQQPQTVAFNQHQQYYQLQQQQQQLPVVGGSTATIQSTPVVNLLDDDQLLSGPPPIEPEKVSCIDADSASSSLSLLNSSKKDK